MFIKAESELEMCHHQRFGGATGCVEQLGLTDSSQCCGVFYFSTYWVYINVVWVFIVFVCWFKSGTRDKLDTRGESVLRFHLCKVCCLELCSCGELTWIVLILFSISFQSFIYSSPQPNPLIQSIRVGTYSRLFIFQTHPTFDPACFIGVDGWGV